MSTTINIGEFISQFGNNLRAQRHRKNMSQQLLADKVGTLKHLISDYERGVRTPSVATICALANALNCHPSALTKKPRKTS